MAPPRRKADPGTVAAIVEDLVFARDAGGLARADASRLAATLALTGSDDAGLALARELLIACVIRVTTAIEGTAPQDPVRTAAARSVRTILIQSLDEPPVMAAATRRDALKSTGTFMQPDSLRKRETQVLVAIAEEAMGEIARLRTDQLAPEALLQRMLPLADVLGDAIEAAIEVINVRDETGEDAQLERALDYVFWPLCQLLLWAAPAFDALRASPNRPIEYWLLEEECLAIHVLPFQESPGDQAVLVRIAVEPPALDGFARSVMTRPETADAARRLWVWLNTCTPECRFHRSTKLESYCSPHQYVALLSDFVDAVRHLHDGTFAEDFGRLTGGGASSQGSGKVG